MFADFRRPGQLLRPLLGGCRRFRDAGQSRARRRRAVFSAIASPLLAVGCLGLASCTYVDRARRMSDVAVDVTQRAALQTVVEADVERQRLRRLRCLDPLLTPATISSAAMDPRLGRPWVDELLRDCPAFSAFLTDTAFARLTLTRVNTASPSSAAPLASASPTSAQASE